VFTVAARASLSTESQVSEIIKVLNAFFPSYTLIMIRRGTPFDSTLLLARFSQPQVELFNKHVEHLFNESTVNVVLVMATNEGGWPPIGVQMNIEEDGVISMIPDAPVRGKANDTTEKYMHEMEKSLPSTYIPCLTVSLTFLKYVSLCYRFGTISEHTLAYARMCYDANRMDARSGLLSGHSSAVLNDYMKRCSTVGKIDRNGIAKMSFEQLVSLRSVGNIQSFAMDIGADDLNGVMKLSKLSKHSQIKDVDLANGRSSLVKKCVEQPCTTSERILDILHSFDLGENEDHSGLKLGEVIVAFAIDESWWHALQKQVRSLDISEMHGSLVEYARRDYNQKEFITLMLRELGRHNNDMTCSLFLAFIANAPNFLFGMYLMENNALRLNKQALNDLLKEHTGIMKHWRLMPTVSNRLITSKEYGGSSFLNTCTSKGNQKMKLLEEFERRKACRREPIALDKKLGLFTHAKAREIKTRRTASNLQYEPQKVNANNVYLTDVLELWMKRDTFWSNGAAGGINVKWVSPVEGEPLTDEQMHVLLRDSMKLWEEKMFARCDAEPGTWGASGMEMPTRAEIKGRGLRTQTISAKKRAAMERILTESIRETIATRLGSAQATTVIKGEAGANRLLLTQDVLTNCVLATAYVVLRALLRENKQLDCGRTVMEELAWLQWRCRATRIVLNSLDYVLRDFDFDNYNIQHTILTLAMQLLIATQMFSGLAGENFRLRRDLTLSGWSHWCAQAATRTTIRWTTEVQSANKPEGAEIVRRSAKKAKAGPPRRDGLVAVTSTAHTALNSGASNTAEINVDGNDGDNAVGEETMLAAFCPEVDETTDTIRPLVVEDYKGDDSEGLIVAVPSIGDGWATCTVLDRTMEFCLYDGQAIKCLIGTWTEWQKVMHDEIGEAFGSAPRTISTLVVSSWQNEPNRDPLKSCPSGLDLISLAERRMLLPEVGAVLRKIWMRRWGKIGHRDHSRKDHRGRPLITKWVELPVEYFYGPPHIRGEIAQQPVNVSGLPRWATCTAGRLRFADGVNTCNCGYCDIVSRLPAMPQPLMPYKTSFRTLQQMGHEMSKDMMTHMMNKKLVREKIGLQTLGKVISTRLVSNYGGSVPPSDKLKAEKVNGLQSYAFACSVREYSRLTELAMAGSESLADQVSISAAKVAKVASEMSEYYSAAQVEARTNALMKPLRAFRTAFSKPVPYACFTMADLQAMLEVFRSHIHTKIVQPFLGTRLDVDHTVALGHNTSYGLIAAAKLECVELAETLLDQELRGDKVDGGEAITRVLTSLGTSFMDSSAVERASPVLQCMDIKAARAWVSGDYRYAVPPGTLAAIFVSAVNALMLYFVELNIVRLGTLGGVRFSYEDVAVLLAEVSRQGYSMCSHPVIRAKCGL
jgi:hypothetical protein